MRRSAHDPERLAAEYLGGTMRARRAVAFETHLVSCEECWSEVSAARAGRALAESLRELAPQQMREDVRAAVASTTASTMHSGTRRRAFALAIAATLAVGVVGFVLVRSPAQPVEITAAVHDFRTARIPASAAAQRRPPDLSAAGLHLVDSGSGLVGSLNVDAFSYRGPAGARVVVYVSDRPFPIPAHAWKTRSVSWRAVYDGVQMLCIPSPRAMLVLADTKRALDAAASKLG